MNLCGIQNAILNRLQLALIRDTIPSQLFDPAMVNIVFWQ
jgi:hypothetical protein